MRVFRDFFPFDDSLLLERKRGTITDRQKEIIPLIQEDEKIGYRSIATKTGINESAVLKHLNNLKDKNILESGGTRGYWKINN